MSVRDVEELRARWVSACAESPWDEAAAVAVLLGFGRIAHDHRFAGNVTRSGVDWEEVLGDTTWSSGERFLIATAAGLWLGRRGGNVDISQILRLDEQLFGVWQDMITAARTGTIPHHQDGKAAS